MRVIEHFTRQIYHNSAYLQNKTQKPSAKNEKLSWKT